MSGTPSRVTPVTPGSDFYSTSAQVIPTLLLVMAVESRALDRVQWQGLQMFFVAGALLGEVAAIRALYVGGSEARSFVVFVGVLFAIELVLQPLPLLLALTGDGGRLRTVKITAAALVAVAALLVGLFL